MALNIRLFILYWLPVFLWMGLIFYLSSIPNLNSGLEADFLLRKLAHIFEYFVLTALFARAFLVGRIEKKAKSFKKYVFISALFAFLYALSDEYHQTFVFGRVGSLKDVGIDFIGIFLSVILLFYLKSFNLFFLKTKKTQED